MFFFGLLLIASPLFAEDIPFEPYVERYPEGRIDWDRGMIYGVGKGYLHLNRGSKVHALKAARALALQSILKVASGVRLDDRETLETLGASGRVEIRLSALVRYEEHEMIEGKDGDKPYIGVTYKAPLKGVEGLTRRLITELRKTPSAWDKFPTKEPGAESGLERGQPWLVVDARSLSTGAAVKPALFPQIRTEAGDAVYDLDKVREASLVKRGMARYVVLDPAHDRLLSSGPFFLERLRSLFSVSTVWAQEKKKRRGGYVLTSAKAAQGIKKTNLILSKEDARRIQKEDASNDILKDCRVIVVVSSTLGGIEGRFWGPPNCLTYLDEQPASSGDRKSGPSVYTN